MSAGRPPRPEHAEDDTDDDAHDDTDSGAGGGLTWRGRLVVLGVCVAVALLTAWYAGSRFTPTAPGPPVGSIRLGPDAGQPVADYLALLPERLPPPGQAAPALVQLAAEATTGQAAALVGGPAAATVAVFRVPLTRVQTALRFEALDPGLPAAAALDSARLRAQRAAAADAARLADRPRDVAAAEAAALGEPACACVLALVVRADRVALEALAAAQGVRAVDAAPVGATEPELALSPLLPGQVERVDAPPDDGPVPPA
ncbi:hypothetical protein [Pseudonocardia humida]|uniref:Uncharacterized protein n=1 Tax=Pseudonocardia humida TaxID=2800819 RepID=A0ABT0ZYU0_9PSEU|nr:hypothetical protein [Pseudonocardia humida]MCO1655914.1 hypothetical protein [Pseudonocardia humida]